MASFTSQRWLASTIRRRSQPIVSRMICALWVVGRVRHASYAAAALVVLQIRADLDLELAPALLDAILAQLRRVSSPATAVHCRTPMIFSSEYPSQPAEVVYAGKPVRSISAMRCACVGRFASRMASASAGVC